MLKKVGMNQRAYLLGQYVPGWILQTPPLPQGREAETRSKDRPKEKDLCLYPPSIPTPN